MRTTQHNLPPFFLLHEYISSTESIQYLVVARSCLDPPPRLKLLILRPEYMVPDNRYHNFAYHPQTTSCIHSFIHKWMLTVFFFKYISIVSIQVKIFYPSVLPLIESTRDGKDSLFRLPHINYIIPSYKSVDVTINSGSSKTLTAFNYFFSG